MATRNQEIAATIIQQLGGINRLSAMTGAYQFVAIDNGVSFKIKNPKANYIQITLNAKDLYDLEVGRIRGVSYNVVHMAGDLYSDMLRSEIEKATGMYLSLGTMGSKDEAARGKQIKYYGFGDNVHNTKLNKSGIVYGVTPKEHVNGANKDKYDELTVKLVDDSMEIWSAADVEKIREFAGGGETGSCGCQHAADGVAVNKKGEYFIPPQFSPLSPRTSEDDVNPDETKSRATNTDNTRNSHTNIDKNDEIMEGGGKIKEIDNQQAINLIEPYYREEPSLAVSIGDEGIFLGEEIRVKELLPGTVKYAVLKVDNQHVIESEIKEADMERFESSFAVFPRTAARGAKITRLEVELEAGPNPDHDRNSHEGTVSIKKHMVKVNTIDDARIVVRNFIDQNDLGSGNFSEAGLYEDGQKIGYISYNGKAWNLDGTPMQSTKANDGIEVQKAEDGVFIDIRGRARKYVLIDTKTNELWANEYFKDEEEAREFAKDNNLKLIEKPTAAIQDLMNDLDDFAIDLEGEDETSLAAFRMDLDEANHDLNKVNEIVNDYEENWIEDLYDEDIKEKIKESIAAFRKKTGQKAEAGMSVASSQPSKTIIFQKKTNPRIEIIVKARPNGQIIQIVNQNNIRLPYVVGQVLNMGHQTWACTNGFLVNGEDTCGEKKIFGIKASDVPQGHEWRHMYPSKFRKDGGGIYDSHLQSCDWDDNSKSCNNGCKTEFAGGGLIAPNGKKSNLTPSQYKLVRTDAFKKWFGDWENSPETASKVVDENGEPFVKYHGTTGDFSELNTTTGEFGSGIYFGNKDDANYFANVSAGHEKNSKQSILPVFLNIKNPITYSILRDKKDLPVKTKLIKMGYDGVFGYTLNDTQEIVAFHPNQVKSAIGNSGAFSSESDNILFEKGGSVGEAKDGGGELRFYSNCVNYPNLDDLNHIIDNEKEITRDTFKKHVNKEDRVNLEKLLGYGPDFNIEKDWHVHYFKSKDIEGNDVYFLRHSAIEYVFGKKGSGVDCDFYPFANGGEVKDAKKIVLSNLTVYYIDELPEEMTKKLKHAGEDREWRLAKEHVNLFFLKNMMDTPDTLDILATEMDDMKQPTEAEVRRAMILKKGYEGFWYSLKAGGGAMADNIYSMSLSTDVIGKNGEDEHRVIFKKYSTDFKDVLITAEEIRDVKRRILKHKRAKKIRNEEIDDLIGFLVRAEYRGEYDTTKGKDPYTLEFRNRILDKILDFDAIDVAKEAIDFRIDQFQQHLDWMGDQECVYVIDEKYMTPERCKQETEKERTRNKKFISLYMALENELISLTEAKKMKKAAADGMDISEKNSNFTNNITKDGLHNIISGKSEVRNGSNIQAALIYLRRNAGTSGSGEKTKPELEKEKLIEFIDTNNLWYVGELSADSYIDRGMEQSVYKDSKDSNFVIKTNGIFFYDSWSKYIENLLLHNYFFPDTSYELVGFKRNERGGLMSVVRQPFIESTRATDLKDVERYLSDKGFVRMHKHMNTYENKELGIIIGDLHDGNVLTKDDLLYFIDTTFYMDEHDVPKSFEAGGPIPGDESAPHEGTSKESRLTKTKIKDALGEELGLRYYVDYTIGDKFKDGYVLFLNGNVTDEEKVDLIAQKISASTQFSVKRISGYSFGNKNYKYYIYPTLIGKAIIEGLFDKAVNQFPTTLKKLEDEAPVKKGHFFKPVINKERETIKFANFHELKQAEQMLIAGGVNQDHIKRLGDKQETIKFINHTTFKDAIKILGIGTKAEHGIEVEEATARVLTDVMKFPEFKQKLPDVKSPFVGEEDAIYKAKYDTYSGKMAYYKGGRRNSTRMGVADAYTNNLYTEYGIRWRDLSTEEKNELFGEEARRYKFEEGGPVEIDNDENNNMGTEKVLSEKQTEKALTFYNGHKEHIDKMVSVTEKAYAPSDIEDKNNPMIWKAEHWKWFLDK